MRGRSKSIVVLVITTVVTLLGLGMPGARAESDGLRRCAVSDGRAPQTAAPEEVGLDSAALRRAISFASDPTRLTVRVFRNNCLIASGPGSDRYGHLAWNMWSSTKSVVSLVTGIAVDEGTLRIDDPIGLHLPPGLGDAAHRAITVRSLLTETSGMRVAVASEGITGLPQLDPNVVAQALAMPIDHPQGELWQYSQRAIDLLAYVVGRAVGEDFQDYAQRKLFDPLGIARGDYHWGRDRSGNTYGYAHLMLPADDFVKIGLLLANRGDWHGVRVVSADYLTAASRPTAANPCYGFLFVVNGPGCGDVYFPGLPPDAIQMSGMMRQDNFIVPSLGLLVSWTGITVPGSALSFPHDVLRGIDAAFQQPRIPDPGPYVQQPDISLSDPMITNPDATLAALGLGPDAYPGCGPLSCLGKPLAPPFGDWPPGCFIVACVGADPATPGIR
ncbi:CubicO group peptidase (beta-lactamase class C family) [Nocardia pseudobrasiliensis]|uniref:CubicO group peptidase (Beta-lactamase class C family) n=2 Tax=Nocardia pseudobrasiliensis TaxID=45979 RepID=A0A370IEF2_9NOCA|nr:CubicO group peptidase (beta-lactamase class C family) [Nocardia pseudobrasiliensis]